MPQIIMNAALFVWVLIWLTTLPAAPENTKDSCRMTNPGYECSLQTEWVPTHKFGE